MIEQNGQSTYVMWDKKSFLNNTSQCVLSEAILSKRVSFQSQQIFRLTESLATNSMINIKEFLKHALLFSYMNMTVMSNNVNARY